MLTTANIEDVTLSLPSGDVAMLKLLSQRMGWKLKTRRKSTTPLPCQYTEEEVVKRVMQATAEAESGVGCLTLDEFETLVETW